MIINKIKLNNIRSHLDTEIDFPKGSILLSGDIGSGKSTILLALEFALFGLRKGILSGSALLRNGKNKGNVELHFSLDDKEIIIKRVLKREKTVIQDTGYIIVNGEKKEATATELTQKILELLNYPMDLLTKGKSPIYRYTIYTPQEEMKQILLTDIDTRLDTLRRVFDIDKYKRVKENTKILTSNTKERIKEFSGRISDLEIKKEELREREKLSKNVEDKIKFLLKDLEKVRYTVNEKKSLVKSIEEEIKKLNSLKRDLEIVSFSIKHKLEEERRNEEEANALKEKIKSLKSSVKDIVFVEGLLLEKEKLAKSLEKDLNELGKKTKEFEVMKNHSEKAKNELINLNICPVCRQKVNDAHKHNVISEEENKIRDFSKKYNENLEVESVIKEQLETLRTEVEELKGKKREKELNDFKLEELKEKNNQLLELNKRQDVLEREINELKTKRNMLDDLINGFKDIENKFVFTKNELENLQENQKKIEIQEADLRRQEKDLNESINNLNEEIKGKLNTKKRVEELTKLNTWLNENFINLMINIEKHIMLSIHNDFNRLFQDWFDILVDTEALKIRIDNDFTPVIEQNGHDINYLFLSGGEKTAAALAYRLALNQVINNIMSKIKTRDLLILDEPTDGFSDEQLDRMRLVLDQLNANQVIIVSHESKIESFVDNVIRLRKIDHVSSLT